MLISSRELLNNAEGGRAWEEEETEEGRTSWSEVGRGDLGKECMREMELCE